MERKPKDQCTFSEYQFFWCSGEGDHRESGTAMPHGTACGGCAREFYAAAEKRAAEAEARLTFAEKERDESRANAKDAQLLLEANRELIDRLRPSAAPSQLYEFQKSEATVSLSLNRYNGLLSAEKRAAEAEAREATLRAAIAPAFDEYLGFGDEPISLEKAFAVFREPSPVAAALVELERAARSGSATEIDAAIAALDRARGGR